MKKFLLLLCLVSGIAYADTQPASSIKLKGATDGTLIGNVGDAIKVSVTGGGGGGTVDQGTPNGGGVNSWYVQGSLGRTWTFSYLTDSVASYQGGVWNTGRTWSLSSGSDALTAFQGAAPWSQDITLLLGAVPSATNSLPARITNGTSFVDPTQIRSLSSISDSVTTVPSGTQTVAVSGGTIVVTQPTGNLLHTVMDSGSVTATISGTPTVTVSNPSSNYAIETGGHLASIDTKLTSPISTAVSVNANSSLSSRQTVTGTESNVAAPSNAVGVLFECESVNADNLRWGFSNASGAILSSTLGVLCEPGRSVDYIPVGVGNYLHMISTGAGSDFMDVQWVLSQ